MNRLLLEYRCAAELQAAARLRNLVKQVLSSTVHETTLHHKILLCLSETVTNIVRHSLPEASQISIRFQQSLQNWELQVSHNGGYYNPDADHAELLSQVQAEAESGRGLGLMQACCEHIQYIESDKAEQNRIVFSWPINRQTDRARVLLVEDQASVRNLYKHYLSESFDVLEARDGKQAMEVLTNSRVDLVLSDIHMPDMDGLTLRTEINRNPDCELTPFVFLTASEEGEMQARAASLGIDGYLLKPVNKTSLVAHVERVLRRSHQITKNVAARINRKISQSFSMKIPKKTPHWKMILQTRDTGAGGGDLLLSRTVGDSCLVALMDTMGHDETAKFFSYAYGGFVSGLMRAAENSEIESHELLQHISEMAYDDELLSKVTLTGVVFKLGPQGRLNLACAAHPPPLLISAQSMKALPVEGILPGLLPGIEYTPVQVEVKRGERIAIYTDGLVESAPDKQSREYLENQMMSVIEDTIDLPIDRAARLIMQKFDEISGTPPRDDVTFILLEPDFCSSETDHAR
jgi:sigma-B regulation protein RsbU (phosphoserine phosphatase)